MQAFPSPPRFTDKYEERAYLKGRLALAFRIFGKLGYDEGVAGHITLRDPVDPTTFWVNPFGVAFSLIKSSDLILVDHAGKVIDGGPCRLLNTAAYMIHAAVHAARPDVVCAAHSHDIVSRVGILIFRNIPFHSISFPNERKSNRGNPDAWGGGKKGD
jgi:ribulose-5-phosphate 4-epimerase/fuculose-1-phosphate aldolase